MHKSYRITLPDSNLIHVQDSDNHPTPHYRLRNVLQSIAKSHVDYLWLDVGDTTHQHIMLDTALKNPSIIAITFISFPANLTQLYNKRHLQRIIIDVPNCTLDADNVVTLLSTTVLRTFHTKSKITDLSKVIDAIAVTNITDLELCIVANHQHELTKILNLKKIYYLSLAILDAPSNLDYTALSPTIVQLYIVTCEPSADTLAHTIASNKTLLSLSYDNHNAPNCDTLLDAAFAHSQLRSLVLDCAFSHEKQYDVFTKETANDQTSNIDFLCVHGTGPYTRDNFDDFVRTNIDKFRKLLKDNVKFSYHSALIFDKECTELLARNEKLRWYNQRPFFIAYTPVLLTIFPPYLVLDILDWAYAVPTHPHVNVTAKINLIFRIKNKIELIRSTRQSSRKKSYSPKVSSTQ